ncbi:DUF1294 domain-containing protein [Psychromonas sp. 14N.309.X.WAT.B.A12]|uniref:DUF1294 domain-containing protein n=1 Tax=unclassified Psychromonas TaxID=2614957 RepID=UPI0025B19673|nr:DUF1294 domain-containing protein [Psychromonas sp. 14N.309.X.WAT.B.A12]MDN2662559.1 DUF1294 domain-containing protein [Psychromonas sp. 14N.309.X.WAT.B.A12]
MHKLLFILLATIYVLAVFYFQSIQWLPSWSLLFMAAINVLSVVLYGMDKLAAIKQWQRTPEKHFHYLALFSGWPGSLAGQMLFNHKTTKVSFRRYFYLMIFFNVASTAAYIYYINR